jgi:hypothetical protein
MSLTFIPSQHSCATSLTLTGLLALAICGCSQKKSFEAEKSFAGAQAPSSDTQSPSADIEAPSSAQPAPGAVGPEPQVMRQPATIVQPDGQTDMKELNRCLLRWLMANKRRPKDFEDFAATAGVPIPPPPAGKQYVIGKDMRIVLEDR